MFTKPPPSQPAFAARKGSKKPASKVAVLDPQPPRSPRRASPALRVQQAIALKRRIGPLISGSIQVSVTDNRAVMLSVRRNAAERRYTIRLHHLFVGAPDETIAALARYVTRNDPLASRQLSRFIDDNDHRVRDDSPRPRLPKIAPRGRIFDLAAIFTRLNARYFDEKVEARITWGRKTKARSRRSIRLASYCVEEDLIRVHPGLDQRWVPEAYLEWVVFHEMLHCQIPIPLVNGRRVFHGAAFTRAEQDFERYTEVQRWERTNIASLLRI